KSGNHGHSLTNEISRQFRQPTRVILGPAEFDRNVAALDVPHFAQALAEVLQVTGPFAQRAGREETDHGQPRLLRLRRKRPRSRRAANNLHEITPSHCRPRSKTTLFGIQLPSSKQKIASSETGLNAQCALRKSRAADVSDGSRSEELRVSTTSPVYP